MAFNCLRFLTFLTAWSVVGFAFAADSRPEQVELFAAIEAEQVEVRLIPKNVEQATVIIKNRTNRPLRISMPKAFAGIPVLAQNNNNNSGGGSSSNQTMGGGMGGGMMGGGMGGMGGGMFDVGPERVGKIKVGIVCLEHGKEDPNPRVAYEMKPIEEFTTDRATIEVLKMLAAGQIDQVAAQAAAWHFTDGLSFNQLASKVKVKHLNGSVEMYFNDPQLQTALQAVSVARQKAALAVPPETASPGEIADANVSR